MEPLEEGEAVRDKEEDAVIVSNRINAGRGDVPLEPGGVRSREAWGGCGGDELKEV